VRGMPRAASNEVRTVLPSTAQASHGASSASALDASASHRGKAAVGTGAGRCEVPRALHQDAGKAKRHCDALLIPSRRFSRGNRIPMGGVAPGNREALKCRHSSSEPGAHVHGGIAVKCARAQWA